MISIIHASGVQAETEFQQQPHLQPLLLASALPKLLLVIGSPVPEVVSKASLGHRHVAASLEIHIWCLRKPRMMGIIPKGIV